MANIKISELPLADPLTGAESTVIVQGGVTKRAAASNFVGPQGPKGDTGATGEAGPAGPTGPQGPAGADGTSVALKGSVNTVGDLPAGASNGDLYVVLADGNGYVWSGTVWNNVGPIRGPKGDTGPQGPQGLTGATGATGATGPAGADGSSAYQVAVANGFVGTEAQWLASLVGPQGPKGDAGATGPQGLKGDAGDTGPQGIQGIQGPKGDTGDTGPAGATTWAGITDKPTTFPPGAHSHVISDVTGLQSALDGKVASIAGKGLSTEDYTTAEKTKLAGVEAGAQVNTVTSVAGKTGAVALVKADVGLANVDNTSDANKPVSTAQANALAGKEASIAAGTASQFWRGDKTWQDFATSVRDTVLAGLTTATSAVVTATDTVLAAIGKLQAQVGDKFDKTGGDITGNAYFKAGVQELVVVANTGSAYTINLALGTIFDLSLTANCVFTFPAPEAGKQFTLLLKQSGAFTYTLPASHRMDDGVTLPVIASGKTATLSFISDGTYWLCYVGGKGHARA